MFAELDQDEVVESFFDRINATTAESRQLKRNLRQLLQDVRRANEKYRRARHAVSEGSL